MNLATPLGIYVHAPFCKHACPYCDFYKMELRERPARERLDFPERAGREHALLLDADPALAQRPLATIYFGGGSPSTLPPGGVIWLVGQLRARHPRLDDAEITLEANPENLTPARCREWRRAGITRLSIGVQSFHPRDLRRLERLHEPELVPRVVANAREAGIDNLSLDLMFGLPDQTLDDWLDNLRQAVELAPNHVSFYGLTIHEGTPFHVEHAAGRLSLPDEDLQAEMYLRGAHLLESAGFEHYEISNFSLVNHRSRHNQRYWTGEDVLGLGPGAHSNVGSRRWANPDDIDAWKGALAQGILPSQQALLLDDEAELHERLFRGLRRAEGLAADSPPGWLLAAWLDAPAGREALQRGLVRRAPGRIALTRAGWLLSDGILSSILGLAAAGVVGR